MTKIPSWVPIECHEEFENPDHFTLRFFEDPRMPGIVAALRVAGFSALHVVEMLQIVVTLMIVYKGGVAPWEHIPVTERTRICLRLARACREAQAAISELGETWYPAYLELLNDGNELAGTLLKVMAGNGPDASDLDTSIPGTPPLLALAEHVDNWPLMFLIGAGRSDNTQELRAAVIHIHGQLKRGRVSNWAELTSRIAAVMYPAARELDEREVRRIVRTSKLRRTDSNRGRK